VAPTTLPNGELNPVTENVDLMRERIWRDLAREASEYDRQQRELTANPNNKDDNTSENNNDTMRRSPSNDDIATTTVGANDNTTASSSSIQKTNNKLSEEVNFLGYVGRPYQTSDLFRNVAFGATIGSITGMCFGFMDSIRLAQSSDLLKVASKSAQGKFVFQGTYRSGMFFGLFFGAFHAVKFGTRVLTDPGDVGEIGMAGAVTLGGVLAKKEWRASLPYAMMLVAMDSFHVFTRQEGKA
jgi:hypothetical protein